MTVPFKKYIFLMTYNKNSDYKVTTQKNSECTINGPLGAYCEDSKASKIY